MRGKPGDTPRRRLSPRITPACAGKTLDRYGRRAENQDHPRVCGENPAQYLTAAQTAGSPPRVRGKRHGIPDEELYKRITPACAGKTEFYGVAFTWNGDHPRVCGENAGIAFYSHIKIGSPPRVRGKQTIGFGLHYPMRITPACAGKTI